MIYEFQRSDLTMQAYCGIDNKYRLRVNETTFYENREKRESRLQPRTINNESTNFQTHFYIVCIDSITSGY